MAKPPLTATIPAGESLSSIVEIGSSSLVFIAAPLDFVDANLSFQISDDGATFYDLIDENGGEVLRAIDAGCAIPIPLELTKAVSYVRIRSGQKLNPVVQPIDCTFALMLG
jgi:hypothetical protein